MLFLLLAYTLFSMAQVKDYGENKRIKNLEIHAQDLPGKMDWTTAKARCAELGEGWRLPDSKELFSIFQWKDQIGNFVEGGKGFYWSATEKAEDKVHVLYFDAATAYSYPKTEQFHARPVRDIVPSEGEQSRANVKIDLYKLSKTFRFEQGSTELNASQQKSLDLIGNLMLARPELMIRVETHSADDISRAESVKLTMQQANSILTYLLQKGIRAERLEGIGQGSSMPLMDNATEAGRKANYRVDFSWK